MSYLQQQIGLLRFDKRLLEINLKSGAITKEEYDQHLTNLSDDVNNSEKLDLTPEDSKVSRETMNGDSHPAEVTDPIGQQPNPPSNTDPFGSGF